MTNKSGVSDQIISLPKGGGELKGMGEKFQPDLYTGTGNFSIPIAIPSGRNGLQPNLTLSYSTGNGNGPFGLGWNMGIPSISRKTSKGIPRYLDKYDESTGEPIWYDQEDIFVLSGSEDLVHVGNRFYRPRTEGLFSKIQRKNASDGKPCWIVTNKAGLKTIYGNSDNSRLFFVSDNNQVQIFQWLISETQDTFGNKVIYTYKHDNGLENLSSTSINFSYEERNHTYNQIYLQSINYVDYKYQNSQEEKFLFKIELDYGEFDEKGNNATGSWEVRPDRFSSYKSGFEIRTIRRCKRILIKRLDESQGQYVLVKSYELKYISDVLTNISLIQNVTLKGHKDTNTQSFPPLTFEYTQFDVTKRRFENFSSKRSGLPNMSLTDPNYEIVDLFGNGLACIVHSSNLGWRYWRNNGHLNLDSPQSMKNSPSGVTLGQEGVQFADMDGDGSVDLLVTGESQKRGYYKKDNVNGEWTKFHNYRQTPTFSLKDPNVKLVDMNGDGIIDILATFDYNFLFIENEGNEKTLEFKKPIQINRINDLDKWPNVFFGLQDNKIFLADISGDGLQDIVMIHSGRVDYWPNLGYGKFGKRITMSNSPRLEYNFDPKRIFLTDVNGDGLADIVYVDFGKVHLWINQSGNSWSSQVTLYGTPQLSSTDSVRIADMKGTGTAGILWSYNLNSSNRDRNYKFLDFTDGIKPLLLTHIINNIGADTKIEYLPSTFYYLKDLRAGKLWKTTLPFPVQVVARVEVYDYFSKGKLVTEYFYHHGYWDGKEREFRGFGRVDQRDTQYFKEYNEKSLFSVNQFNDIPLKFFSPPTETINWFHQGSVFILSTGHVKEQDFSNEYWPEDKQLLFRPKEMDIFIENLPQTPKHNALRALRGSIIRTEVYILDATNRQQRPYTVTENLYGITSLPINNSSPFDVNNLEERRRNVFFPHLLGTRTTKWEGGVEPMSNLQFTDNYDNYGQPQMKINIAVPRSQKFDETTRLDSDPYLVTVNQTTYAVIDDETRYIVNKVSSNIDYEIKDNKTMTVYSFRDHIVGGKLEPSLKKVIGQTINYYDGEAFVGLSYGEILNGALVRIETLAVTDWILKSAYEILGIGEITYDFKIPPYLLQEGLPTPQGYYPQEFLHRLKDRAGYSHNNIRFSPDPFDKGYFTQTERRKYDFHDEGLELGRGLITAEQDELDNTTKIEYDDFKLMPIKVIKPLNLVIRTRYNYYVLQPEEVIDVNDNLTNYEYTPLGLLNALYIKGKSGASEGDVKRGSKQLEYNFNAFIDSNGVQPIHVISRDYLHHDRGQTSTPDLEENIKSVEYSDGFGRIVQTRKQCEDVLFDDEKFGKIKLSSDQSVPIDKSIGIEYVNIIRPRVVVSGFQTYDNKGRVVEKYEPFFSKGWEYEQLSADTSQKITMLYDGLGRMIKTVNPDGSEQQVVYGIPSPDLKNPESFIPTPWEVYIYDLNDNAGRAFTRSIVDPVLYNSHWNTPSNIVVDALGRKIISVERNGENQNEWYTTKYTYDIKGNLLTVVDPIGRIVSEYVYDILGQILRTELLDTGKRFCVFDAFGNVIEEHNSNCSIILNSYDTLERPIRIWAKDKIKDPSVRLHQVLIYGDDRESTGLTEEVAKNLNLLGKLYKHFDESGLISYISDPDLSQYPDLSNSKPYDSKGNILQRVRKVISDQTLLEIFESPPPDWKVKPYTVDWQPTNPQETFDTIAERILDPYEYRTSMEYDALNRIKKIRYPKDVTGARKLLEPKYNRAGDLQNIRFSGNIYVQNIGYNARGQITIIAFGNNVMTRYAYDEKTFRLSRMRTESFQNSTVFEYKPSEILFQDLGYEYDLIGNIIKTHDRSPKSGVPSTSLGTDALDRTFSYSPLYRLISATGREHKYDFLNLPAPWSDNIRIPDHTLTREYKQEYKYDPVGNIQRLKHTAENNGPTHIFEYVPNSNRLMSLNISGKRYEYSYDNNGNVVQETALRNFQWDHSNRLKSHYVQSGSSEPSMYTQYLYDSEGNRIKKIIRKQGNNNFEVTVYIDELFEYHLLRNGPATSKIENNTLHIMDDKRRLATIRVGTPFSNDKTPAIKYHFVDHLNSSNVLIDNLGQEVNKEEYYPFGESSFGSVARKKYRFNGKEKDDESGLFYFGSRYYAPWLCRWFSCDPAGFVDGLNLYEFVLGNPIKLSDIDGQQSNREVLGLDDRSVGQELENDPSMKNVVKLAAKQTLYDLWDIATAGFVSAHDELFEARTRGEISESDYIAGTFGQVGKSAAVVAVASVTGGAGGRAATTVTRAVVQGAAAGAVSGLGTELVLQYADIALGNREDLDLGRVAEQGITGSLFGGVMGGVRRAFSPPRVANDVNVNPRPPPAKSLTGRQVGQSQTQNDRLQKDLAKLQSNKNIRDIRVNQQQINAQNTRVGVGRPDVQSTERGLLGGERRHYMEYDTSTSTRGPSHEQRLRSNDPMGWSGRHPKVTLIIQD